MKLVSLSELRDLIAPIAKAQKLAFDPSILECVWYPPLCDYTRDEIAYGIQQTLKNSAYNMKPSAIIEHLKKGLGHPPPQIAWSYCLLDEKSSGWITDTIAAAQEICAETYRGGDKIGAKQVFIQAYEQQVSIAESAGLGAKWFWSGSSDGLQKTESAIKLVNLGHMPKSRAVSVIHSEEWRHQNIPRYIRQLSPPARDILIGGNAAANETTEQLERLSAKDNAFLESQQNQHDIKRLSNENKP